MRVSTKEQKFDLQQDALVAAGVAERYLYQDVASGAKQARLGLEACLKALHPGDTLVVWKLDRAARSLLHLLEIMQDLQERQVGLRILEGIGAQMNPTTNEGKLFLSMLGAFAEFERTLIRERVVAGLVVARARGHKGGRRPKLSAAQQCQAQSLKRGGMAITEIAQTLQCSRHTVYKALGQTATPVGKDEVEVHQGRHTTESAPSPRDYFVSSPGARRYWRVSVTVPVSTTGQSTVAYVP